MTSRADDRLREILDEIARIGPVLPGSISDRTTRCQRDGCHCRGDPPVLHGPYPTWTWRPAGVAVTKTLTPEVADLLAPYSRAHHRLRRLLAELEDLSLEIIEQREGIELGRARSVGRSRPEAGD